MVITLLFGFTLWALSMRQAGESSVMPAWKSLLSIPPRYRVDAAGLCIYGLDHQTDLCGQLHGAAGTLELLDAVLLIDLKLDHTILQYLSGGGRAAPGKEAAEVKRYGWQAGRRGPPWKEKRR